MLQSTNYTVSDEILQQAIVQSSQDQFKVSLNQPDGDFFYDPWKIKSEFKNTVWEKILDSLPELKGEARIITLKPGNAYYSHADADDRWHLNLKSEHAFLCDIDDQQMYPLRPDGVWYQMNAGKRHSAVNFGNTDRTQIVVRQLLKSNKLSDAVPIKIILKDSAPDFRYHFDNTVSVWLNKANKTGIISNFKFFDNTVSFDIENAQLDSLKKIVPDSFEIVI
jgi:hypothetical protein